MDLQQLQKKYEKQLLTNSALELKDVKQFSIPLHTVALRYNPVVRSAMDILMKMMLLTFKRTPIKDVTLVADILFVEPLFITDLTNKMMKIGLLTFDEHYRLTAKGESQLATGIFEDELEETTHLVEYSEVHREFLTGNLDDILDLDDYPDVTPYANEELEEIDIAEAIPFLQAHQPSPEEDESQLYVTSINGYDIVQVNDSPCIQYILYEAKTDKFIVRIFNVYTNSWDEKLEQIVQTHELNTYEKNYK